MDNNEFMYIYQQYNEIRTNPIGKNSPYWEPDRRDAPSVVRHSSLPGPIRPQNLDPPSSYPVRSEMRGDMLGFFPTAAAARASVRSRESSSEREGETERFRVSQRRVRETRELSPEMEGYHGHLHSSDPLDRAESPLKRGQKQRQWH